MIHLSNILFMSATHERVHKDVEFLSATSLPDSSQALLQPGGRCVQGGWWTSASPEAPPSSLIGWTLTASLDEVCEAKRSALVFQHRNGEFTA